MLERKRFDLYHRVTDQIVEAIEKGAGKFEMPWHTADAPVTEPRNAVSGSPYKGVNIIVLWATAYAKGYQHGYWATYRQWQELGGQVRKGETGTAVIFYKQLPLSYEDIETGEEIQDYRLVMRAFTVFNASQVEGWTPPEKPRRDLVTIDHDVEGFIAHTGADLRFSSSEACYVRAEDYIQLPPRDRFTGTKTSSPTEAFYSTVFHELVHWTGHNKRLGRNLSARFGQEDYAMEELVAELGAAYLCAWFEVSNEPRPDHAAYVANWLKVLKNDKRAIFAAVSKASEATGFLLNT